MFSRGIFSFATKTTTTSGADILGRTVVTAVAPAVGAAVCLSGRLRAQVHDGRQCFMHAGERDGMPWRLQMMPDFSILDVGAFNRTMARFLLEDVLEVEPSNTELIARLVKFLGLRRSAEI